MPLRQQAVRCYAIKFNPLFKSMLKGINLRIVLQNSADGTVYGLQKGKGTNYETVQAQLGNGQDLTFDFTVHVKEANGSLPILAGPFRIQ